MATAADRLLRRLEWQVLRRLDGRLQGAHRTVLRGAGIDVTDLRAYSPSTTSDTSTGTSPPGSTNRTYGSTPRSVT
ncbi:hypothetical protein Jiend_62850 [Micromonospora endophytica]|uniref:hypothetical protein n=1 Tax=Micromonospora endophytica TaxID=515350 RepID=UPI001C32FACD|nr:hypothetical protein [Micromonospora endophytica]BCJ62863.1 hypothetical protein Jiend_62850 [Micromonospora endophytica]